MRILLVVWLVVTLVLARGARAQHSGCGLRFDGINDQLVVPPDPSIPDAEFTVTAWVQTSSSSGNARIMSRGEDPASDILPWGFGLRDGALYLQVEFGSSASDILTGGFIADGMLHHVAATRDAGGTVVLYVDGAPATSSETFRSPGGSSSRGLQIGFEFANNGPPPQGPIYFFDGVIDELTLWNLALSPSDIQAIFTESLPPSTAGLLGHWKLDEGSGQTAADSSSTPVLDATLGTSAGVEASDPSWVCSSTSTTTSVPTTTTIMTTTTTLPRDDCDGEPVAATFSSINCRLVALVDRVASEPNLGRYQQTLPPVLQGAAARLDGAVQSCTAGELKPAKTQLKRSAQRVDGYAQRLSNLRARKRLRNDADLRKELVAVGRAILSDINTLRRTLSCP